MDEFDRIMEQAMNVPKFDGTHWQIDGQGFYAWLRDDGGLFLSLEAESPENAIKTLHVVSEWAQISIAKMREHDKSDSTNEAHTDNDEERHGSTEGCEVSVRQQEEC